MDVQQVHAWMNTEQGVPKAGLFPIPPATMIVALVNPPERVQEALANAKEGLAESDVDFGGEPVPGVNDMALIVGALLDSGIKYHMDKQDGLLDPMLEALAKAHQEIQDAYTKYVDPKGLPTV